MEQVTITREWHQPQITTTVTSKEISLSFDLGDYLLALAEEVGNPALLMTQGSLLKRMQEASDRVVAKVKLESAKVV